VNKGRFLEQQIAFALKQAETGTPVAAVLRRMGISEQTFYHWNKLYGGLGDGRVAAAEAAQGREPQARAARGRSKPRQAHPVRHVLAKKL
jgi:putative transposase